MRVILVNNETNFETDENYHALIIGNNNYDHLIKLDAAINDATVLSKFKKYGFNVELLIDANYDTIVNSHIRSKKIN